MIGDYKGKVKYKVITALLQTYLDTLDYDGMKSILKEAGLLELRNQKDFNPENSIDYFSFKKILAAQNCLLYQCSELLFEIGRKFSFYLFPFGKNFEDSIREITELIDTDWNIEIIKKDEEEVKLKVENCIFCTEIGISCTLFKGFIVHTLEKTLTSEKEVICETNEENLQDPNHNSFILTLKIKNKKLNKIK
ncbi:MAG: hypothetical protein KGD57_07695 [Candidatus Lokiarchaeota archaeon]|nr:hypothetical protein [Candidatus Lokiarchaeota archaeon]